jgi:hypothetical protein
MALGTGTMPKTRRPTAFEVSFPNEHDGDREEDEDAVDEGYDVQISRHTSGKRKHESTAGSDGRVRIVFAPVSLPFQMPLTRLWDV